MLTIRETMEFSDWLMGLRDGIARARIARRISRLAAGNPGDVKPVGQGISELRIDYGPGYRVYFVQEGSVLIVLLCGGDKSSQSLDITRARKLAIALKGKAMPLMTREFDAARYLDSAEAIAAYIADATEGGDAQEIAHALGVVARARGMSELARDTGLPRQTLYKALSGEGNPELGTIAKVADALGYKLALIAKPAEPRSASS
jgi:putative addiction module killer protein/probable addiction module antidote protein